MRILLLILSMLLAPLQYALSIEVPYGKTAPDFTLQNIEGADVSLKDFKDEVIAIIYWEVDHDYSYRALEDYRDIFRIYKRRGVQFIGIAADTGNQNKVSEAVTHLNIRFPVLLDSSRSVLGSYGIRVYPTTLLIDRKGKLVYAIPGHPVLYISMLDGYLQYILGDIPKEEIKAITSPQKTEADESELMAGRNYNLALKFSEAGLVNRAMKTAETAVRYKPDMIKARNLLGFFYLQTGKPDKAIQEFRKTLDTDPESFDAKAGIGMACLSQGEVDYAIQELTQAVKLDKKSSAVYYELGKAYELKGDKEKALGMYKKSLTIADDEMFLSQVDPRCRQNR
ncbi:MAG: redoxin domain-containing protein [Nitrospiraceae bacterium]|nr:MAG: redoxin domain-containing protein [Nitrospiraceae bacterium]